MLLLYRAYELSVLSCDLLVLGVPPVEVNQLLSLHDALPILRAEPLDDADPGRGPLDLQGDAAVAAGPGQPQPLAAGVDGRPDRKSIRLNSSHLGTSYTVLCLKKKILPRTPTFVAYASHDGRS